MYVVFLSFELFQTLSAAVAQNRAGKNV